MFDCTPTTTTDQSAQLAVIRQILTLEELLLQFRASNAATARASNADLTRRASLIADLADLSKYDAADADPERGDDADRRYDEWRDDRMSRGSV